MPKRKTPAQLDAEIAQALRAPRGRQHTIKHLSDKEYRCSCGTSFRSDTEAERHHESAEEAGDTVKWT